MFQNVLYSVRQYGRRSLFFKIYLLICLTVVCVTTITCVFGAAQIHGRLMNENERYYARVMERVKENLDAALFQVDSVGIELAASPQVRYYAAHAFREDGYGAVELQRELLKILSRNKSANIDSTYLLFRASGEIVTNSGTSRLTTFYDSRYLNGILENWETLSARTSLIQPVRKMDEPATSFGESYVVNLVRFAAGDNNGRNAVVTFNLRSESLRDMMLPDAQDSGAYCFITDADSRVILDNQRGSLAIPPVHPKQVRSHRANYHIAEYNGEDCLVTYIASNYYGLTYIQAWPLRLMMSEISATVSNTVIVGILIIVLGCGAAVMIAAVLYHPIAGLFNKVTAPETEGTRARADSEVNALSLRLLYHRKQMDLQRSENTKLLGELERSKSARLKACFQDMLFGNRPPGGAQPEVLARLGWRGEAYLIMLICMDSYDKTAAKLPEDVLCAWKEEAARAAEETVSARYTAYCFQDNERTWILAADMPAQHPGGTREFLTLADDIRAAIGAIRPDSSVTVSVAVGSVNADIAVSYMDAVKALQLRWKKGQNKTLLYDQNMGETSSLSYPLKKEKAVIDSLKCGDFVCARASFESFAAKLAECPENAHSHILFFAVAIDKLFLEMGVPFPNIRLLGSEGRDLVLALFEIESFENALVWVRQIFESVFLFFEEKHRSKSGALIAEIIAYIEANYSQDIYLSSVSDRFHISESHLSKMFKNAVGKNFLEYLNNIRIECAKMLIKKDATLPVSVISSMVGYSNVQTFIRIFKKQVGVTPGEYRKECNEAFVQHVGQPVLQHQPNH